MELLDKLIYKFFESVDSFFSFLEKYSGKFNTWLWHQRVKHLRKKRKKRGL